MVHVTSSCRFLLPLVLVTFLMRSRSSWSVAQKIDEDNDNSPSFENREPVEDSQAEEIQAEEYTALTTDRQCGGSIVLVADSRGSLVYPGDGLYDDNVDCQWTLEAPKGMVVEFTVTRLAVQRSRDCGHDRLELFEIMSSGVASSLSGRLCGYINSLGTGNSKRVVVHTSDQQVALVRFLTDDTVGDTGFELQYRAVHADMTSLRPEIAEQSSGHRHVADRIVLSKDNGNTIVTPECPSIAVLTAKYGVIKYPQQGNQYPNNAVCQWLITTPPGNMDSLTIFNGPNERSMVAAQLCGVNAPTSALMTRTHQALVRFVSNGKQAGRGFELRYDRVERGGPSAKLCSSEITELPRSDTGQLHSPGFNQSQPRYPIGATCRWRIAVSAGKRIQLVFSNFSMEEADNCSADSLSVFDGSEPASLLLGRFCGHVIPPVLTTSGHEALVTMSSDLSGSSGGFSLTWTSIERNSVSGHKSKECPLRGCDGNTLELDVDQDTEKTLHSPNFGTGDEYPSDAWCSWLITAPSNMNVFLRFESFDVERPYSGTTCYDALVIYDGPDDESDVIGTYCGDDVPPDVLTSTNQLFVVFKSDSSSQGAGFLAHYSAKENRQNVDSVNCGVPDVQPNIYNRIVGGDESAAHSWPWQVSLQYSQRGWQHWCGGSVLAHNWIITAAHCFYNFGSETDFRVVIGEHNRAVNEGPEKVLTVSHVIIHEKYNSSITDNDIALLKLRRNITFNRTVKPICLPRVDIEENTMCITTGWGDTRGTGNSSVLNQLHVPILSRSICNQSGWYAGRMTDNMMCAGYPEGRRDSCQGDSGGPLVCLDDGRWVLYGLTSWGENCASSHKPGIYTRTVKYLNWIQQKTGVSPY